MSLNSSKSKSSTSPLYSGTSNSSVQYERTLGGTIIPGTGVVNIDPSIRALQNRGISTASGGAGILSEAVGKFGASLGDLRSKLFSNLDPYISARVNPIKEERALAIGSTERDLGRRGLTGSSFAPQTLANVGTIYDRQIADQGALATQEGLSTALNIDQMLLDAKSLEAQGRLEEANYLRQVAADRANLEAGLLTATGQQGKASGFGIGLTTGGSSASTGGTG